MRVRERPQARRLSGCSFDGELFRGTSSREEGELIIANRNQHCNAATSQRRTQVYVRIKTRLHDIGDGMGWARALPDVGASVLVRNQRGTVRFVGETDFAEGVWIGLELERPVGRNDGSVQGVRYFSCQQYHGLFCPPSHVTTAPATAAADQAETLRAWADVESLQEAEALQVRAAREVSRPAHANLLVLTTVRLYVHLRRQGKRVSAWRGI